MSERTRDDVAHLEETKASIEQASSEPVLPSPTEAPGMRRRDLLKVLGLGAAGLALPHLVGLPKVQEKRSLDGIDGRIVGDDFSTPHRWRDGKLASLLDKPGPITRTVDVAIVGGGIAGLVSAWRLEKAGVRDYVVFDRSDTLGGMAVSGKTGNRQYPWGAHYVDPPSHDNKGLCKLYEDLKVIVGYHPKDKRPICDPAHIVKPPHRNILAGGRWRRGLIPWGMATPHDRKCMAAFAEDMDYWARFRDKAGRRAFGFPIEACSREPVVRALDGITMLAYLRTKKWLSPLLLWAINDRCIDEFSLPVEHISAWAGIQYFASVEPLPMLPTPKGFPSDPIVEKIDPSDRRMSWPDGNAFLARQLIGKLPAQKCMPSHMVLRIKQSDDHAMLTVIDMKKQTTTRVKARYVIFAAPKYMIYHCMPELVPTRKAFRDILYVPWMVGAVHVRRPPSFPKGHSLAWENNRFRSWSQGYINPQHHTEPTLGASLGELREPMVLSFYACLAHQPHAQRREFLQEGWGFWARQMIEEMARMHPTLPETVTRVDVMRWGHAMHGPRPGFLFGGTWDAIRKPAGRVFFSQADTAGLAVFEQVVHRGIRVAEDVMRALPTSFSSYL